MNNPGWTQERTDMLRELWANGLSASECARELGWTTRNAVISKVHRLRLEKRGMTGGKTVSVQRAAKKTARHTEVKGGNVANINRARFDRQSKPVVFEVSDELPDVTERIGLLDLSDRGCKFISGDPLADHSFCNAERREGSPYCDAHHRRTHFRL